MNKVTWLYRDPAKTTPEEALRIACRVLRRTDAGHIAMALRHRRKYPDHPAGHCGLTQWMRKVIKTNDRIDRSVTAGKEDCRGD
jgi:hypothetical protein